MVVTDPDGKPLSGAAVTFTLPIPGFEPVSHDDVTDANGVATFRTTIQKGATPNLSGRATVVVTSTEFGQALDSKTITIIK